MTGADTRRTARELGISGHTVHDHPRAVFGKSGTHSRAELVRAAHGRRRRSATYPDRSTPPTPTAEG